MNAAFIPNPSISITNANSAYVLEILDYDTGSNDDLMVTKAFYIYESSNKFPEKITIFDNAKEVLVDVYLTYEF